MKKFQSFGTVTLLIVSLLTSAAGFINVNVKTAEAGAPSIIFSSSFEPETLSDWSYHYRWENNSGDASCDNKKALIKGDYNNGELRKDIPTSGYNSIAVSFSYKVYWDAQHDYRLENGNYIKVQYSHDDGANWHTLTTLTNYDSSTTINVNTATWTPITLSLGSDANNQSDFRFRFYSNLDSNQDEFWVDCFNLTGNPICTPTNGGVEICDNIDNNCNGQIDENLTQPTTCGVGICAGNTGIETCTLGNWGGNTCNPLQGAGTEICDGSQNDEDCDGISNEGCQCTNGNTQPCGQTETGECAMGLQTCTNGAWGGCVGNIDPTGEICDNLDNDCDGNIDEDLTQPTTCGVGICDGNTGIETCTAGSWAGDTCNRLEGAETEICGNGIDENCDGSDFVCSRDYCGMYFNHIPDGIEFEGPINGLVPGDTPFNHSNWWDIAKLAFERNDSSLAFGNNFLPVDQGFLGDPFHFTVHWRALLNVPADGNYGYTLGSDDDSWLYIGGNLTEDLGGVHAPTTRNNSVFLTQGQHVFNLYFAERHTTQSYLNFAWTTPGIDIVAQCEPYCGDKTCNENETCGTCAGDCGECPVPKCGDGIVNQTSEQCDGQAGVPEHYTCTTQCTLEYVPYCGDQNCDSGETCTSCENDCGICPCDPNTELVVNGGFETPEVTNPALWDIFNSSLTNWITSWMYGSPTQSGNYNRPEQASLELQKGAAGDPNTGLQLAELDTDWFGPSNPIGAPAATKIYQDIQTVPGRQYTISFWFSPRPDTTVDDNALGFSWDGINQGTITNGATTGNTNWKQYTYTLTAIGSTTRIEFSDLGQPSDSLGTYLDDVSVRCCQTPVCVSSPEICNDQIDNDCDGQIDCADPNCVEATNCTPIVGCNPGTTRTCETGLFGICAAGTETCNQLGVWGGECVQNNQPGTEICDGIDNDCDNAIDEDLICSSGGSSAVITGGGGGHLVVCGDGITELSEQCDDGNKIDGDTCSSTCTIEMQGEVLGESTTLPQTGEDAVLLIVSSIIVALGAGLGLKKKLSVN